MTARSAGCPRLVTFSSYFALFVSLFLTASHTNTMDVSVSHSCVPLTSLWLWESTGIIHGLWQASRDEWRTKLHSEHLRFVLDNFCTMNSLTFVFLFFFLLESPVVSGGSCVTVEQMKRQRDSHDWHTMATFLRTLRPREGSQWGWRFVPKPLFSYGTSLYCHSPNCSHSWNEALMWPIFKWHLLEGARVVKCSKRVQQGWCVQFCSHSSIGAYILQITSLSWPLNPLRFVIITVTFGIDLCIIPLTHSISWAIDQQWYLQTQPY